MLGKLNDFVKSAWEIIIPKQQPSLSLKYRTDVKTMVWNNEGEKEKQNYKSFKKFEFKELDKFNEELRKNTFITYATIAGSVVLGAVKKQVLIPLSIITPALWYKKEADSKVLKAAENHAVNSNDYWLSRIDLGL